MTELRAGQHLSEVPGLTSLYVVTPGEDHLTDVCGGIALTEIKLPRGVLPATELALNAVAVDFGEGDIIAGHLPKLARAALEAAMPLVRRSVLREAARQIRLLDDLARGLACPACHGKPAKHSYDHVTGASTRQCGCGRSWTRGQRASTDYRLTAASSIARLARGEPLPDLPAKETPDA